MLCVGARRLHFALSRHGATPSNGLDALIIGFGAQPSCSASDLEGVENDITGPLAKKKQKIARTLHGNAQGSGKYG
jgi:hypothetical protein